MDLGRSIITLKKIFLREVKGYVTSISVVSEGNNPFSEFMGNDN